MMAISLKLILLLLPLISCSPIIGNSLVEYDARHDLINYELEKVVPPDALLNVKEIIQKYGYPLEVHHVTTEDGYILEMHRIPHGIDDTNVDPNRPVVLLMHGLLCSSADWIMTGTDKGLGFILADAGYDVWMGNARGNTWSRNHTSYDPDKDSDKFWDFSWNEIGIYDIPAKIDRILDVTQQEKIFYIGHSQGTTVFFVMLSEKPEYNAKIRMMSALAPVAYMGKIPNFFLRLIAFFQGPLGLLLDLIGVNEFLPSNNLMQMLGQTICQETSPIQGICSNILFLICGYDSSQLNDTALPVILSHTPAGAATKQFLHYSQEVNSHKFRKYDYGLKNLIVYHSFTPPKYNINNIQAPVALYYGENDKLMSPENVDRLAKELPNVLIKYKVHHDKFNHLDFLWANDVVPLLYNEVISHMSHY